jgi:hypothetical protein
VVVVAVVAVHQDLLPTEVLEEVVLWSYNMLAHNVVQVVL